MNPTIGDCIDKLQALGSSQQIADFFEQEGIRGTRKNSFKCAAAVYLKRETGLDRMCVSAHWAAQYGEPDTTVLIHWYSPLEQFIREFDRGQHPKLVDT